MPYVTVQAKHFSKMVKYKNIDLRLLYYQTVNNIFNDAFNR